MEDLEESCGLKCIICCCSRRRDFKFKQFKKDGYHQATALFRDLCKQLELMPPNETLVLDESLSVCTNCVDNIDNVLDTKRRMETVERRVRELQLKIIQEVKEVQAYVDLMSVQLGKIERAVKDSDGDILRSTEDTRRKLRTTNEKNRKRRRQGESYDVDYVRKSLSNVTKDLLQFRDGIRRKVLLDGPLPAKKGRSNPIGTVFNSRGNTNRSVRAINNSRNDFGNTRDIYLASPAEPELECDTSNIDDVYFDDSIDTKIDISWDVDPSTSFIADVTPSTQPANEVNSANDRVFQGYTRSGRKVKPTSKNRKTYYENEDEDDENDSSSNQVILFDPLAIDNDDDDSTDSSLNDSDFSEFEPESKSRPRPSTSKGPTMVGQRRPNRLHTNTKWPYYLPEDFDFSGMSDFKISAIKSLMYRSSYKPPDLDGAEDLNLPPEEIIKRLRANIYAAEMECNPETRTFYLQGVEIIINEENKTADCTQCSYKARVRWPPERLHDSKLRDYIKHHILTHHLNMIKCDPCSRSFSCLKTYKRHLQGHQNLPVDRPPIFPCDVCGKILRSSLDLKRHLYKHKSAEEVKQLLESGEITKSDVMERSDLKKLKSKSKKRVKSQPQSQQRKNGSDKCFYYLPEDYDFTGMSNFKKFAIQSIMLKHVAENDDEDEGLNKDDTLERMNSTELDDSQSSDVPGYPVNLERSAKRVVMEITSSSMDYNAENGTFFLKGIEVKVNEADMTVECGECSYKTKVRWPPDSRHDKNVRRAIRVHIFSHHLNALNCQICDKPYHCIKGYKRHVLTHGNIHSAPRKKLRKYLCQECGRSFVSPKELQKHSWDKHKTEEEKQRYLLEAGKRDQQSGTTCLDCGMAVPFNELEVHKALECKSTPDNVSSHRLKCEYCDKTFKSRETLNGHVARLHTSDERPFECEVCFKTFRQIKDIKSHYAVHATEKPFVCRKGCGKAFAAKRRRTVHENLCKFKGLKQINRANVDVKSPEKETSGDKSPEKETTGDKSPEKETPGDQIGNEVEVG